MKRSQTKAHLALAILLLAAVLLACGTGYRTTQKLIGNSGEVRVGLNEASGTNSTEVEFSEDWSWTRVAAAVSFSVESGSCRAVLSGEEGTSLTLDASAGSPGRASGDLVTDAFGEVTLETECQDAKNLDLLIQFSSR